MMVSNPFYFPCAFYEIISEKPRQFNLFYPGGGGDTWVDFCEIYSTDLSELPTPL